MTVVALSLARRRGAPVTLNAVSLVLFALIAVTGFVGGRGVDVWQLATPLITHAEIDRSAAASAAWMLVRFWANLLSE